MKIELSPELTEIALEIGATHYDVVLFDFIKKVEDNCMYYSGEYPSGKWVSGVSTFSEFLEIDFDPQKDELLEEIERLKAEMNKQWMPIESAPKNELVIVFASNQQFVAWLQDDESDPWYEEDVGASDFNGCWCVTDNKLGPFALRGSRPTHWMPLPPNPEE